MRASFRFYAKYGSEYPFRYSVILLVAKSLALINNVDIYSIISI